MQFIFQNFIFRDGGMGHLALVRDWLQQDLKREGNVEWGQEHVRDSCLLSQRFAIATLHFQTLTVVLFALRPCLA